MKPNEFTEEQAKHFFNLGSQAIIDGLKPLEAADKTIPVNGGVACMFISGMAVRVIISLKLAAPNEAAFTDLLNQAVEAALEAVEQSNTNQSGVTH